MQNKDQVLWDIERCTCHVPDACHDCSHYNVPFFECCEKLLNEAHDVIKQMEQQLNEFSEKEIPKKPIMDKNNPRYGMGHEYYDWICPTCKKYLAFEPAFEKIPDRCPKCGQKLIKLTRQETNNM